MEDKGVNQVKRCNVNLAKKGTGNEDRNKEHGKEDTKCACFWNRGELWKLWRELR